MNDTLYAALVIAGLTLVSVVNRSFFFISTRPLPMPPLVQHGLRYAPLAALMAVVGPEVVGRHASLSPLVDPRPLAALAAAGYALARRDMLGTILVGMGVFALCRWLA